MRIRRPRPYPVPSSRPGEGVDGSLMNHKLGVRPSHTEEVKTRRRLRKITILDYWGRQLDPLYLKPKGQGHHLLFLFLPIPRSNVVFIEYTRWGNRWVVTMCGVMDICFNICCFYCLVVRRRSYYVGKNHPLNENKSRGFPLCVSVYSVVLLQTHN